MLRAVLVVFGVKNWIFVVFFLFSATTTGRRTSPTPTTGVVSDFSFVVLVKLIIHATRDCDDDGEEGAPLRLIFRDQPTGQSRASQPASSHP